MRLFLFALLLDIVSFKKNNYLYKGQWIREIVQIPELQHWNELYCLLPEPKETKLFVEMMPLSLREE